VAQKSAVKDEPEAEDLYSIGCVANILQMLKLPDGTVKVLVEGYAARPRRIRSNRATRCLLPRARPVPLKTASITKSRPAPRRHLAV
jgi:ATP-dependent Lon protease